MNTPDRLKLIKELANKRKRQSEPEKKANTFASKIIKQAKYISKLPCDHVFIPPL